VPASGVLGGFSASFFATFLILQSLMTTIMMTAAEMPNAMPSLLPRSSPPNRSKGVSGSSDPSPGAPFDSPVGDQSFPIGVLAIDSLSSALAVHPPGPVLPSDTE
jgi:hypothetical protein